MKIRRCASVAAVAMAVCTVVFWCVNRSVDETADSTPLSSSALVKSVAPHLPTVTAASGAVLPSQMSSNQTATVRGTKPYVLELASRGAVFDKSLRLAAEACGARTAGILSTRRLLIEADAAALARLAADGRFSVTDEFRPSRKLSPALAAKISGGAESVEVSVITLSPEDHRLVQDRVVAHGGEILKGCVNAGTTFRARLPATLVTELAGCGDVRWMETFVRPRLLNDKAVEPAAMNVREVWEPHGLTGDGQYISTSDSGVDLTHQDLTNQVYAHSVVHGCVDHDAVGHGTHTAGSIAGDGTMSGGKILGTAYEAKLFAWFCGKDGSTGIYLPGDYDDLFRPGDQAEHPNFIHSASWGSAVYGEYDASCQEIDEWVWNHPDFLPVFSAGNEGPFSGTIGSPAAAKNVLAIGATLSTRKTGEGVKNLANGNPESTASFSSQGPCLDGRTKPDIAAPGVQILSTRAWNIADTNFSYGVWTNANYVYDTGTSMSCPLTAGAVALVRQWLTRDRGFSDDNPPSAALMKAVITGGAVGMTPAYSPKPSIFQGWGRVNLAETLFPKDRAIWLKDRLPFTSGCELSWVFETTNAAPFDAQLVWLDYKADPAADQKEKKLIIDLDLTVEPLEGGKLYYGNGGKSPDRLNPVESVHISQLPPGKYLVTVSCPSAIYDYESGGAAAIYVRGAFDGGREPETVANVRNRRTEETYLTLDMALDMAETNDVLELIGPALLRQDYVVQKDCTIVSTNGDPSSVTVRRTGDARLIVTNGVSVTLSNVVFSTAFETNYIVRTYVSTNEHFETVYATWYVRNINEFAVMTNVDKFVRATTNVSCWASRPYALVVEGGGRVVLDGPIGVGGIVSTASDAIAVGPGFTSLFERIMIDCAAAREISQRFAVLTGTAPTKETLFQFVCDNDRELGGSAAGSGVVWHSLPVDENAAAARLVRDDGTEAYFASLRTMFKNVQDGDVIEITADTEFTDSVVISNRVMMLSNPADPTDTNRGVYVVSPRAGTQFTIIEGGSLTISNLVFDTYEKGQGLFTVDGDGAEMILESDAILQNLTRMSLTNGVPIPAGGGAVTVKNGTLTLKPGSTITRCRSQGTQGRVAGSGGAIYLYGTNCTLNILGGSITDCFTEEHGGAVFAGRSSTVNIEGPSIVYGNYSGSSQGLSGGGQSAGNYDVFSQGSVGKPDDIYFENGASGRLTGPTRGQIGISWPMYSSNFGNDLGCAFLSVACDQSDAEDALTLMSFINDGNPCAEDDYTPVNTRAALSSAKDTLVWELSPEVGPEPLPPGSTNAVAHVIVGNVTNDFATVEHAFASVKSGSAVIEILSTALAEILLQSDITVRGDIVFRTVPQSPMPFLTPYFTRIIVPTGSSLAVTNMLIDGEVTQTGVFKVDGGRLTLGKDTSLSGIGGYARSNARDGGPVTVYNRGTFCLEDGAVISNNLNDCSAYKAFPGGCGGAVLVDNGIVCLRGGTITGNVARRGGGVFVCNGGEVHVSGGVKIVGNTTDDERPNDIVCSDDSMLYLDDEFTGKAGVFEHYDDASTLEWRESDTNVFGEVASTYAKPVTNLAASAARFFRDQSDGDYGQLMTNGSAVTKLVWRQSLRSDGSYVDSAGVVWYSIPADPVSVIAVPMAVSGLLYTGEELTGVKPGEGYVLAGNTATNAGTYTATATLEPNYCWADGSIGPKEVTWMIGKATYDMSGVTFEDASFPYDGNPKSIFITGELPTGVMTNYEGNGQTEVGGPYEVIVHFTGDADNYNPINDMKAMMVIYTYVPPPGPTPGPGTSTNYPTPIAFMSITRLADTNWVLVVTNRRTLCWYRLIYTDDLSKGFTETGAWEQATETGPWTTNVIFSDGDARPAYFWRAEGTWGTDEDPPAPPDRR